MIRCEGFSNVHMRVGGKINHLLCVCRFYDEWSKVKKKRLYSRKNRLCLSWRLFLWFQTTPITAWSFRFRKECQTRIKRDRKREWTKEPKTTIQMKDWNKTRRKPGSFGHELWCINNPCHCSRAARVTMEHVWRLSCVTKYTADLVTCCWAGSVMRKPLGRCWHCDHVTDRPRDRPKDRHSWDWSDVLATEKLYEKREEK